MLHVFLTASVALGLAAPSTDGVRDVLLLPGEGQVWIALEGAPSGLQTQGGTGRLELRLDGFDPAQARTIRPLSGPIDELSLSVDGSLMLSGGFGEARAELREGGVLIEFAGAPVYEAALEPVQSSQTYWIGEPQAQPDAGPVSELSEASQTLAAFAQAPDAEQDTASVPAASRDAATPVYMPPQSVAEAAEAREEAEPIDPLAAASEDLPPGPCDPTAAVIASSPWDLDALARHADCLAEIGETENAAGLYERILAFEPSHFQAALGLARLREVQGRTQDAARLFETAASAALTDGQALAARQAARRLRETN